MGEDDSQQAAGQEPRLLLAACKGGLSSRKEGQGPAQNEGVHLKRSALSMMFPTRL